MSTSYKAQAIAAQLKADLIARGFSVVAGLDASSNPTLSVGTMTTGSQNCFIRVTPMASINTDILGLAQNVFTPHVVQIALEESAAAGLAFLLPGSLMKILGECSKTGVRNELYMRATGQAVAVGDITSANLLATWDMSLQYPLAGQ